MTWKKVLCPVDFSEPSREALRVAARTASVDGAELVLVHAWTPPVYFLGETIGLPPSVLTDLHATAERELSAWKTEALGYGASKVSAAMLTGAAWNEIVGFAKHHAIDLIVLGTHGRTGLKHALLGSVTEKIVRHSPCAVLVVPPPR